MFCSHLVLRSTRRTLQLKQLFFEIAFQALQFAEFSVQGFHLPGQLAFFLLNRINALVILRFKVVKLLLQILRDLFHIFDINSHCVSPD
ncbi:Uncharacterised protein [Salmonella enterica subsp. enterica serovar Bovismorbificans]|nr:Uncharacterised protein [Salmonella enterica subsp. enterica serovar Bovismorbificans]